MEILLLHPGGLGDVILSLPAVALLREKFPAARLTFAGNLDYLLPVMNGYAECVVSISTLPLHSLYTDGCLIDSDVRFWRSFDRIISWTGSGDPGFVQRMKAICPGACIASWRPDRQEPRHVSQLFIDSLGSEIASGREAAHVPVIPDLKQTRLGLQWLIEQGWKESEPLAAIHPGAGSSTKRWPLDRFVSIARHLIQLWKKKVLIIEGPAESGLAEQIVQELPKDKSILARFLSLEILASVIAKTEVFVGNDSGISHLAAALGVPSIVLFGPTLPRHWAPLGPHVKILWDESMANITVEEVIQTWKCGSLRLLCPAQR